MGITIHFEGSLRSVDSLSMLLQEARAFANEQAWPYVEIPNEMRSLARVRDEADWDYAGLTSGFEISPHKNAEPLRLEFDYDGYIQEYIKTQFAPLEIHLSVVNLLRKLEPYFASLDVVDESDFWETNDIVLLRQSFDRFFEVVEDEKAKNPRLTGPYRLENGRIADFLED
ncbi:hypothetical protein BH20ACI2_BH20ACI2_24040 [soil metagenome]